MSLNNISVKKRHLLWKTLMKKQWSKDTLLTASNLIAKCRTGRTLDEKEASREKVADILLKALAPVTDEAEVPSVLQEVETNIQSMQTAS